MKTIYKILLSFGVGVCLIFAGISMGGLTQLPEIGFFQTFNIKWCYKSIDDIKFSSQSLSDKITINVHKGNVQFYEVDSLQNIEIYAEDIYNGFEIYQKGNKIVVDQPHYFWFSGYDDANIKIYVPTGYSFKKAEVNMNAGVLKVTGIKADKLDVNSAAGKLDMYSAVCNDFDLDAGMGKTSIKYLTCQDNIDIDLGMGDVDVMLKGYQEEYNYSVDVGLGNVKIGDDRFSGIADHKMNHGTTHKKIDVDCGMGSVTIEMED